MPTYPPSLTDTDVSPPLSTLPVGLVEIDVGRSYGLRLYLPVPIPEYLLTHPELPIYRDVTDAVQKLSRSLRAPMGMSRVFHPAPFTHRKAANTIRLQYRSKILELNEADLKSHHGVGLIPKSYYGSYYVHDYCGADRLSAWNPAFNRVIAVLDTPLITDPSTFRADTLTLYPNLTCVSDEVHNTLLERDEFEEGPLGIFGLPSIKGVRLTKTGKIRRKPGATIRAAAAYELEKRGSTIIEPLTDFAVSISRLMNPERNQRGIFYPRHLIVPRMAESSSATLNEQASNIHKKLKRFNEDLQYLLDETHEHEPRCRGILRSRLIYLCSLHSSQVNQLLVNIHQTLPILKNYPTTGYRNRISQADDLERSVTAVALHRNLYRLALAMIPGRSDRFMFPTPAAPAAERLSSNDGQ